MAHTFRTEGAGAQQTLHEIEDEKIPVYDTQSDAEADLANLAEGQIVATKDAGTDEQTLIEYVDGRLETTTTEIAMDTFKTGSKAQLYKSGNNVQFRYYAEGNSTFNPIAENTWVTIGTIPEGFRPKSRIEAGMQGGLGGTLGLYAIDTTGAVQVFHYPNTGWAAVFAIQCDYNIDGTNSHGMTVNTLKDAKDYTDAQLAGKVTERNITSTVVTSTMDYFAAIKAMLDSIDFSTWENKTYAGKFTSNGQAPNQWNGSYQLSKVSNSPYGITILGEANNLQFTGIWENATNGWKVRIENAIVNRSTNGNFIETYSTHTNYVSGTNQYRCHMYGKGPLQEFIDFIRASDYANVRTSNGVIGLASNGTPNIYGKNKFNLDPLWTVSYSGAGALWYYHNPIFFCPSTVASTEWRFFFETGEDNAFINPSDWIAAGNAQVLISIEVIK